MNYSLVRSSLFVGLLVLCAVFPSRAFGQSVTIAWDPAVNDSWVAPEYRIYVTRPAISDTAVMVGSTSSLFFPVDVSPGETIHVAVASHGWRLDESMNVVWAEGERSTTSYTAPGPSAPPAPPELCAPDGSGNGVDEDGDALYDEVCAASSVSDATGAIWTIAPNGAILRNGIHASEGYAQELLVWNGNLYAHNLYWPDANGSWWLFVTDDFSWRLLGGDPRLAL